MEDLLKGESVNKRPILRLRCNLNDLNLVESNLQSEFELEIFKRNKDESRYLDLNNQIFKGHPDQSDWDLSKLLAKMGEVWFRPDRLIFMKKDGRDLGFFWLKEHQLIGERVCEIFVIGIIPSLQGEGLGKKILTLALKQMISDGYSQAWVYTDESNERALKLYRSFGFEIDLVTEL
ncbi:MAG: GNAT family N-acetyltransferase [Actinobacteria bacterium]|nr:GNAT family N-acetyltransferase [Actinomycetota bacterium]NCU82970.1 GNAT family N-acetyltransferase [Actinomycetota bacterium]NCV17156.1 GNAT family N-acetyltransferase [Actinomycetota bacterium]NDA36732.1 GNAT family N-acetyltransferase [Actinomycetota bacterium]NDF43735.1 GNAT family N-acetyltransferase [Actinomycetota bacterium]